MKKFRNCEKIFMPKKLRQKNGGLTFDFKFKNLILYILQIIFSIIIGYEKPISNILKQEKNG